MKIIDLKGSILSLTVLRLNSDSIQDTKAALQKKIEKAPDFFAGIPVVLEPQVSLSDPTYLALLVEHLHQFKMIPIGIRTEDQGVIEQAEYAGLAIFPKEPPKKAKKKQPEKAEEPGLKSAKIHQGAVRSGQQVVAKDRDLIIMGSVNPGAEVIADGHVHVFGKVMGKVFAGASGEAGAKIFAKQLNPELVCIAGAYQLAEDIADNYKQGFVEVSLDGDALIFNKTLLD